MPRPVSMRVSYRPDAAYLLRFQTAITKDSRRTAAWRRRVQYHVNKVVQLLLEAQAADLGDEGGVTSSSKKGKRSKDVGEVAASA